LHQIVERFTPVGEAHGEEAHQVEMHDDQFVAQTFVLRVGLFGRLGAAPPLDESRKERPRPLAVAARFVTFVH
jgi:hypothetical protein